MTENSPDLSLILNSASTPENILQASLKDIRHFFTKLPVQVEIVVVKERHSLNSAMMNARGSYCFIMGGELCHPLAEIIIFLTHFYAHPETHMISASRGVHPTKILYSESRGERLLRIWSNRFIQKFFLPQIDDALCEFKAFRNASAKLIFSRQKFLAATQIEVLLLAQALDQKVDVLPIRSTSPEPSRKFSEWLKLIWELLSLRLQKNHSAKGSPLAPESSQDHQ